MISHQDDSSTQDSSLDQVIEVLSDDSQDVIYGPKSEYCYLSFAPDVTFSCYLNPSLKRLTALRASTVPPGSIRGSEAGNQIVSYFEGWRATHESLLDPRMRHLADDKSLPSRLATKEELMTFFREGATLCEVEGCCKSALEMSKGGFEKTVKGGVDWFMREMEEHGKEFNSVLDRFEDEERKDIKKVVAESLGEGWEDQIRAFRSATDEGERVYFPVELAERFI
ncbi:hypothetical protein L198_04677 [Cryptococcus wingfieldii CBS 7118]|uniref:Uncharacterized protein n=1 Tax=Cryptococcus wingfieldii CBS 7118 TaxID=1295528 RepID=A0A1E3J594_9TREE|nr:hypothetical protein L198_04677 [Cryptococcus wingfieldii CBS 7118]ODN95286.1 hypothetical protein L198_04677 [Cryptococcus wingfieldii CBS 7118]